MNIIYLIASFIMFAELIRFCYKGIKAMQADELPVATITKTHEIRCIALAFISMLACSLQPQSWFCLVLLVFLFLVPTFPKNKTVDNRQVNMTLARVVFAVVIFLFIYINIASGVLNPTLSFIRTLIG